MSKAERQLTSAWYLLPGVGTSCFHVLEKCEKFKLHTGKNWRQCGGPVGGTRTVGQGEAGKQRAGAWENAPDMIPQF